MSVIVTANAECQKDRLYGRELSDISKVPQGIINHVFLVKVFYGYLVLPIRYRLLTGVKSSNIVFSSVGDLGKSNAYNECLSTGQIIGWIQIGKLTDCSLCRRGSEIGTGLRVAKRIKMGPLSVKVMDNFKMHGTKVSTVVIFGAGQYVLIRDSNLDLWRTSLDAYEELRKIEF